MFKLRRITNEEWDAYHWIDVTGAEDKKEGIRVLFPIVKPKPPDNEAAYVMETTRNGIEWYPAFQVVNSFNMRDLKNE